MGSGELTISIFSTMRIQRASRFSPGMTRRRGLPDHRRQATMFSPPSTWMVLPVIQ